MINNKAGNAKRFNKERGITLVALIVTIIILVILAAVTIDQVFDLKIVETAINGTQNYTEAQIQEKEDLEDTAKLLEDTISNIVSIAEGKGLSTEEDGVKKHIKTLEGLKEVNTKDIYGAEISSGYRCAREDVTWQIFYIDEEDDHRVYLIAKDYMAPPVQDATPKLLSREFSGFPKEYSFGINSTDTSILGNFAGDIPDTTFTQKFLNEYAGESASEQENLQATNYMLNQTIWAEYKDESKADGVYGGPTLPLFVSSYNDICEETTKLGYKKDRGGYQINQGGGRWGIRIAGLGNTETQKGIYFKSETSGSATGMWLASPALRTSFLISTEYSGNLYMQGVAEGRGFCPVVSLQSSVQFTENENGTYSIN